MAKADRCTQRRQRQSCVDLAPERVANDPPRPSIEYHREADEAAADGDVGDIGDPELVGTGGNNPRARLGKMGLSCSLSVVRTKRRSGRTWRPRSRMIRDTAL